MECHASRPSSRLTLTLCLSVILFPSLIHLAPSFFSFATRRSPVIIVESAESCKLLTIVSKRLVKRALTNLRN